MRDVKGVSNLLEDAVSDAVPPSYLGTFPGEGQTEKLYTSEIQETHRGRPFQSAFCGWSVPTRKVGIWK